MMLFLLFVAFPIIVIFLLPKAKKSGKNNLPPGPIGLPFIGNLHQFDSLTPHIYFWKLTKIYGKIFTLKFGSTPIVVISSAKLAKEVLKTQDLVFCSRPSLLGQQKLSYNGHDIGFAPYNDHWRERRKICVLHLFSLKKVQSFSPIREDEVSRMIKKIYEQAVNSKITNLSNLMISLTSTIICRIAFGVRFDEEGHERKRFDCLLAEAQAMSDLDEFYEELIEQHQNPNRAKSMEGDILDLLLQLKKERSTSIDLTLDDIKGILMDVFVAGSDTSAAAVEWAMTALIKNPKIMKKVQKEIRETIGTKGIVNEDDIQNMSYFKSVIKETFRLYPPAPLLIPRETMKKSTLEGLKKVQSFSPIREDEVSRMIKKISQLAASSQITNLSSLMISLTSTIICRVAFGVRFDEEAHERKRFDYLLAEAQAMMATFFVSDFFPSLSWIDKLTGQTDRLERNFKNLNEFYEELIEQHQNPNRPKSMEGDILDLLLQLKKEQSTPIDLTMEDIKGLLMNVLVAGSDTSAAVVVWAMTALMKNPKVMKKVQEEIRKSIGTKGIVNEDDIQNMSYLKAVIKETFRLYPPDPLLIPRESMKKSTLEGYEIQPGTIVHINAWAIARDPEIWENPKEFIPERFLNSDIDFKKEDYQLIPFGAGRRGCPGITLGITAIELALSNLLYAFDWELPYGSKKEDIDTNVRHGITMHKKNDLCLIPKKYF
ncbi:hypothetical protein KY289_038112 [Solanum tuberosum]|nr:hypothetical protein KY289_038112 [Solanum tuberosum]